MTVTASDVKAMAPEFDAVDDAVIEAWIERVENRTNRTAWGSKADDGVTFLVLHWLTIRAQQEASGAGGAQVQGPVTSETVGPLSRSFAAPAASSSAAPYSDAWLGLSSWGLAHLELRGTLFPVRIGC